MSSRIPPVLRPEHPSPRSLAGFVQEFGIEHRGAVDGLEVTGVTLSTADLHPGDLFVGVQGLKGHGAAYAAQAREGGAVAVLTDAHGAELAADAGLPILLVEDPRLALGEIAAWVYRTREQPPLLFGTTGTNGKTSTSYLLEAVLRQLGLVTGLSSTSERHIGELTIVSRLTTPEASEMHALLARMRESGVRAVAVEVSAQALTHHRVDGLLFDVAGFTNLSHDHLDDYPGETVEQAMERYLQAKLPLFQPELAKRAVVCLDTAWGARVVEEARIPVTTIATVGHASAADLEGADWTVEILDATPTFTEFRLSGPEGRSLVTREPLIGWHMAANAALGIVMLVEAGFELEAIGAALDADGGIRAYLPGRTERVSGDRGPSVYVDFGHSPDAFENTLAAVRQFTTGKTIMLFGADGDRDATKRSEMGRVAAQGSDILVITDHHPRFEDPQRIRTQLLAGAALATDQPEQTLEVSPPEAAIVAAVGLAKEGDSILWAGPGHQDYRDIEGVRTPYSARELARAALREAGW